MPGLTLATDVAMPQAGAPASSSSQQAPAQAPTQPRSPRPTSPDRPPVSPITPPATSPSMRPAAATSTSTSTAAAFARGRPALMHTQQVEQVGVPPPPPPADPVDLDANPDALALRSAISILQLQRRRAADDVRRLHRAKADALARPAAFFGDLARGRVRAEGDALFTQGPGREEDEDEDEDEEEDGDHEATAAAAAAAAAGPGKGTPQGPPSWVSLPKPQNVVRCPPINWSQYAVVGESLDKLHADQVARPTGGNPAVVSPSGHYEFKGSGASPVHRRPAGIAAPYAPGRDRLDKKSKTSRR